MHKKILTVPFFFFNFSPFYEKARAACYANFLCKAISSTLGKIMSEQWIDKIVAIFDFNECRNPLRKN